MITNKMTIQQINYLNIGLMIVAAFFAFRWPFETFLFAYAFFGPLHYLTEISWLHDKNYYTKGKYDYIFLLAVGVFITLLNLRLLKNVPDGTVTFVTFLSFMCALVFVLTNSIPKRIGFIFASIIVSVFITKYPLFESIFGAFLPTLIHVFVFTGLFILVGALKGRDLSGILSLIVFVGISIGLLYITPDRSAYHTADYVRSSYGYVTPTGNFTEGFISLNETIRNVFNLHDFGRPNIDQETFIKSVNDYFYKNPTMLAIMAFIGFAYMYHYFNWFSKTSVIQWHNMPRSRFVGIIIIWILSVALYAYDYAVGLKWLFFLSFSHVILEFPLNHLTLITIGKETRALFTSAKPSKPNKQAV
jgi:hypothetical protein